MAKHTNAKHANAKKSRQTVKQSSSQLPDTAQAGTRHARASSDTSARNTRPVAKRNKHAVTVEEIPDEDSVHSSDEDEDGELGNVLIITKKPVRH